ncbi:hypothetical protein Cni_G07709 [Canna indica]|uniref:RING-type domain-containing protein n=1 Tax=Canna indica TaxID=4628 RepID=A0AAQ3JZD2_9LILI|nr:hypothetical protein Cni_G07709 [Canna indica]
MALPPPPPPTMNKWSPSSSPRDFDANMATVVVVVACASAVAVALHAALRLLLRRLQVPSESDKPATGTTPPPQLLPGSVVFDAGATAVAGAPECAICLAELAEGERVRVMPACGHGFHAQCVDAWLVGRSSSCPTCRADWWPPAVADAEP